MPNLAIEIKIDDDLFKKIQPEYEAVNYTSAIKTAILYLTEEIRERTDLDSDGESLVTKAFSEKAPLIKINRLETESEKSEQIGFMNLLQGLYKAIRNPRNHNLKVDTKAECDELLTFINMLVRTIKASKSKFDYQDFLSLVNDMYFRSGKTYATELVKSIPSGKSVDVALKLVSEIQLNNCNNIGWTVRAIKIQMVEEERDLFFPLLDQILLRTQDFNVVRASTIIMGEDWTNLSKTTRIRLESMLFEALKRSEFIDKTILGSHSNYRIETYMNDDCVTASYFRYISGARLETMKFYEVKVVIEQKLRERPEFVRFLANNLGNFIFTEHYILNEAFDDIMIELMTDQKSEVYKMLTEGKVLDGDFEPYYSTSTRVRDAIENINKKSNI